MTLHDDYLILRDGIALLERSDRALLEVRGRDRLSWLNNFVTNAVKHLRPGEGTYAFALNGHGRILFDVNILVLGESLWLDLAQIFLDVAQKHLGKYIITEDVTILDRSKESAHFAVVGARAGDFFERVGVPQFAAMPALGHVDVPFNGTSIRIVRNDFCGPMGGAVLVPRDAATAFRDAATDPRAAVRATSVGHDAVQVHRMEAGIRWPGAEITDEYLPAETRQLDRAVSFTKGCYLGQEVVERMRSRKVVARELVGLVIDTATVFAPGTPLRDRDDKPAGTITSACRSVALDQPIALGYVRSGVASAGNEFSVGPATERARARVAALPFSSQS